MADKLSITEFHRKHSQISFFHHSGEIQILSFIVDVIFEYRIYNHWTYPHFSGFEVQLKKMTIYLQQKAVLMKFFFIGTALFLCLY